MLGHILVNCQSKLIHSVAATVANVHNSRLLGDLLLGEETRAWGDSGYVTQREVIREHAPQARDFTNRKGTRNRLLSDDHRRKDTTMSRV